MQACEIPKGDMLPNPVYVLLDKTGLASNRLLALYVVRFPLCENPDFC